MALPVAIPRYVVCVHNEGCDDLTLRKVYAIVADLAAAKRGYVRVVDDSGEDYLYPKRCFAAVRLSPTAQRELAATATLG